MESSPLLSALGFLGDALVLYRHRDSLACLGHAVVVLGAVGGHNAAPSTAKAPGVVQEEREAGKGWGCENASGHWEELGWGMEHKAAGLGDEEMVQTPVCSNPSFASLASRDV